MKNLILAFLFFITATSAFAQAKYTPNGTPDKKLAETYGIHLFRTGEGTWFDLQDDNGASGATTYFNILDWLQGRVAGLQVYHYRELSIPLLRNQPATVYVDEVRVDYSFLNALSTTDIALIKVVLMASSAGVYGNGGAIAIYTKRGEAEDEES